MPPDYLVLSNNTAMWANVIQHLKRHRVPSTAADFKKAGMGKMATFEEEFPAIMTALKSSPSIKYDPAKQTFQWIFTYDLHKGKEDLVRLLELNKDKQGFMLQEIEESYPGPKLQSDVEELEHSGDILLVRHQDWRKWKIYYNDKSLVTHVDQSFKDMWEKLGLPEGEDGFEHELSMAGLKVQVAEKQKAAENDTKKKSKRGGVRMRLTNTHLKELGIGGFQGRVLAPTRSSSFNTPQTHRSIKGLRSKHLKRQSHLLFPPHSEKARYTTSWI